MEAEDQYKMGLDLKAAGQFDAALTAFRRAAIANPNLAASQMEIGLLCRDKAKLDKMFLKYAYDAFQKAARLDPNHEQAHTYYIMLSQQLGQLDNLLEEYSSLSKKYPENQLLAKCHKNIIAISMAMMPQQVNVGTNSASGLRKFALIFSLLLLLIGIGFLVAPSVLLKQGKIQKDQVPGMIRIGFLIEALGIGGFILRSKLN